MCWQPFHHCWNQTLQKLVYCCCYVFQSYTDFILLLLSLKVVLTVWVKLKKIKCSLSVRRVQLCSSVLELKDFVQSHCIITSFPFHCLLLFVLNVFCLFRPCQSSALIVAPHSIHHLTCSPAPVSPQAVYRVARQTNLLSELRLRSKLGKKLRLTRCER